MLVNCLNLKMSVISASFVINRHALLAPTLLCNLQISYLNLILTQPQI